MRDIGNNWITGTVRGPGATRKIRPLDRAGDEDIPTAIVDWDEPALGTDTVAVDSLQTISDEPRQPESQTPEGDEADGASEA